MDYQLTSDILSNFTSLSLTYTNQDGVVSNTTPTVLNQAVFTIDGDGFASNYAVVQSISVGANTFTGVYDLQVANTLITDFALWATGLGLNLALTFSETNSVMTVTITGIDNTVSNVILSTTVGTESRIQNQTVTPYILFENLESGLHTFKLIDTGTTTTIEEKCTFVDLEDKCVLSKELLLDYYLLREAENCRCKCNDLRTIWGCLQADIENNCDDC